MRYRARVTGAQGRTLRIDAVRNHERIAIAATEVFEELGSAAPLEEIARRAGVGVATLYRRFGNRDTLVAAALEYVMSEFVPILDVDTGDPWADLVASLEASVELIARRRALVGLAREAGALKVDLMDRYLSSMGRLLGRAVAAGLVRPELRARDLAAVVVMAVATINPRDPDGADRRRYLALLIDGMRPSPRRLPEPAADPHPRERACPPDP